MKYGRVRVFFFSSRRRHTRSDRDWSSDVCSSDLSRPRWARGCGPSLPSGVCWVTLPIWAERRNRSGRRSCRTSGTSVLLDATTSAITEPAPPGLDGTAAQDRAERRTVLVASLVGTTVEWYDFFLYATAATIVFNHAFFPSQSSTLGTVLAFATFAVGFVMRPIGGFVL